MRIGDTRHEERGGFGKPLDGIRILAAEQMQALPYATQLMAYLGAEVVKVEHPVTGDSGRGAQPRIADADGREVGEVTSGMHSPLAACGVAIAYVEPEYAASGELAIDIRGKAVPAERTTTPFVRSNVRK